jgi:hypothetical protein
LASSQNGQFVLLLIVIATSTGYWLTRVSLLVHLV